MEQWGCAAIAETYACIRSNWNDETACLAYATTACTKGLVPPQAWTASEIARQRESLKRAHTLLWKHANTRELHLKRLRFTYDIHPNSVNWCYGAALGPAGRCRGFRKG